MPATSAARNAHANHCGEAQCDDAETEQSGPGWRSKFGNLSQVGTLLTMLATLFGGVVYIQNWERERRLEAAVQGEREGSRAQLISHMTASLESHNATLVELVRSLGATREDVRRIEGKLDQIRGSNR